jgi:hypothetical protein
MCCCDAVVVFGSCFVECVSFSLSSYLSNGPSFLQSQYVYGKFKELGVCTCVKDVPWS